MDIQDSINNGNLFFLAGLLPVACLNKDLFDIWCFTFKPNLYLDSFEKLLSDEEIKRAQRLQIQKARDHFVVGRGFLRLILAEYLDTEPYRLDFHYNQYGKPVLAKEFNGSGVTFNLSHSHNRALYGVAVGRTIGVDIEKMRSGMNYLKIAARFFSKNETEVLQSLPEDQHKHGFFNCWTRKEAYLKAMGQGLFSPLRQFDVSLAPGEKAELQGHDLGPEEITRWFIQDLDFDPDYKAAFVIESQHISFVEKKSNACVERLTYQCHDRSV